MKHYSRLIFVLMSAVLLLSLSACGESTPAVTTTTIAEETTTEPEPTLPPEKPFAPVLSGIYVMRDGTVKSAEITPFDSSEFGDNRYNEDSLRTFVEREITAYNESQGKTAITLDSLTINNKEAQLILAYDSAKSFMDFQGEDFNVSSLRVLTPEEAKKTELTGMVNPAGEYVSMAYAQEEPDLVTVAVSGRVRVTVSGELWCYTETQTKVSSETVRIGSDEVSYIIFK